MLINGHGYRTDPCPECGTVRWAKDQPEFCLQCAPLSHFQRRRQARPKTTTSKPALPRTLRSCEAVRSYLESKGRPIPDELEERIDLLRERAILQRKR